MTAAPCAHSSCGNITRDSTGLCHWHRWASNGPRQAQFGLPPTLIPPTQRKTFPAVLTGILEPAAVEVTTYSTQGDNGPLLIERHLRLSDKKIHREDGGPAYIVTDPDGTLVAEMYVFGGETHRIDGPAKIDYDRRGEVAEQGFFYRGLRYSDRAEVIEKFVSSYYGTLTFGRFLPDSDMREEFHRALAASSFRTLLEEGHGVDEIMRLLDKRIITPDGIREVLAGAPIEWVRSYERGASA